MRHDQMMRDAFATASVLSARLPMLMLGGFGSSALDRTEMTRMVSEKMWAAASGAMALQLFWWQAGARAWQAPFAPETMARAYAAWSGPGRRTLRANARRLGR